MTAAEIISVFEGLVDDSLSQETALALLNAKKDMVEDSRDWSFLMARHSPSGQSFTLPDDYKRTVSLHVGGCPYAPFPFERRSELQAGRPRRRPSSIPTRSRPRDRDLGFPVWPDRFHKILAFSMAADFYAVDQEERGRSWEAKWMDSAELMLRAMKDWDVAKYRQAAEAAAPMPSGYYVVDPTDGTIALYQGQAYGATDIALGIY